MIPSHTNQKGFINIALVVLLIVLAGTAAYLIFIKKPSPVIPTEQSSSMNTPTPPTASNPAAQAPPLDQTASWKIYQNSDFNFEIRYSENTRFVEDKLENLKKDRMRLYGTDEWYEIAPVTFFEKSTSGEFADRLIIDVINLPLTGKRKHPFTSLDDYIEYQKNLLNEARDTIKNLHLTKTSIGTLEALEETYEQIPLPDRGSGETKLYAVYHNGLIFTFILGSDDPKLLDVYKTMVKTFRFISR